MVKLQKRFAYRYKEKEHYKYVVTIPTVAVQKLNLKPETEFKDMIANKSIILKPIGKDEVTTPNVPSRKHLRLLGEPAKE